MYKYSKQLYIYIYVLVTYVKKYCIITIYNITFI